MLFILCVVVFIFGYVVGYAYGWHAGEGNRKATEPVKLKIIN